MKSNVIQYMEHITKNNPQQLLTLSHVVGSKLETYTLRILMTELNDVDFRTLTRCTQYLHNAIQNATTAILEGHLNPDNDAIELQEPGHAYFWRGVFKAKLGQTDSGQDDVNKAYVIYDYWDAFHFGTLMDKAYDIAERKLNRPPKDDEHIPYYEEMCDELTKKYNNHVKTWLEDEEDYQAYQDIRALTQT